MNGITVTPVGDDVTISPHTALVGSLDPDGSREIKFDITPSRETVVTFVVTYHNGINDHTTNVTLPVRFSEDKLGADPVLNDVSISSSSSYTTISCDVTNAGLSSAYAVTVTVGSPATPVDPNKLYVLGELAMDDFSSFEVTYTGSGTTIPVIITYKDSDGNTFSKTYNVTQSSRGVAAISGSSSSSGSSSGSLSGNNAPGSGGPSGGPGGGGMSLFGFGGRMGAGDASASFPFLQVGSVLIAILAIVIVAWKKGYLRKLLNHIPRHRQNEDDDDQSDR